MDPSDAIPLMQVLGSYSGIFTLHAAAKLGIADALKDGPLSSQRIASGCNAHEPALRRLLHALDLLGVVVHLPDDTFQLTPTGHWLRADVRGSARGSALMCGDASFFAAWAALPDAVRSGRPSFETANGASFFDYVDRHPELLAAFQNAMTSFGYINDQILATFDFSTRRAVIDLGGGSGSLAMAIANAWPEVRVSVLDRPSVIEAAPASETRIEWLPGDFLASIPGGADTHVLRFVLSDWSDADVLRIFRNSFAALPSTGTLIVVDNLQPPQFPSATSALDLSMLVLTGGQVRTAEHYHRLLRQAGFEPRKTVDMPSRATLIAAARRPA